MEKMARRPLGDALPRPKGRATRALPPLMRCQVADVHLFFVQARKSANSFSKSVPQKFRQRFFEEGWFDDWCL